MSRHRRQQSKKASSVVAEGLGFEEAKKVFFSRVWALVPGKWRLPLAGVIVIGGGVLASHSVWYPPLRDWWDKPPSRITIGGDIFSAENAPLAESQVQLLDSQGKMIAVANTDSGGYVTFNVVANCQFAQLLCADRQGKRVTLPLARGELRAGKTFHVRLDLGKVDYR